MRTLVLLPGLDGTGLLFDRFLESLGPGVACAVLPYPADPGLGYDALFELVLANLPDQGELVILGESFSGPIAIRLAAALPHRVKGLILCCSFAKTPRGSLRVLRSAFSWFPFSALPFAPLRAMLLGGGVDSATQSWVQSVVRGLSSALIGARLEAVATVNTGDVLARLQCPVLYLQAAQDRLVPQQAAATVLAVRQDARLKTIAGPHALLQVRPRQAVVEVQRFLETLPPLGTASASVA